MLKEDFSDQDLTDRINQSQSFSEMAKIALEILKRTSNPIAEVCGPISTGGLGSVEKNLRRIDRTIRDLQRQGIDVFDQIPFEETLQKLKTKPDHKPIDLLEGFYLPLLKSGKIKKMYFLPDWQTSFGASWEHEQAKKLGIEIIYLKQ